jgi:hypothetical protein
MEKPAAGKTIFYIGKTTFITGTAVALSAIMVFLSG